MRVNRQFFFCSFSSHIFVQFVDMERKKFQKIKSKLQKKKSVKITFLSCWVRWSNQPSPEGELTIFFFFLSDYCHSIGSCVLASVLSSPLLRNRGISYLKRNFAVSEHHKPKRLFNSFCSIQSKLAHLSTSPSFFLQRNNFAKQPPSISGHDRDE